MLAHLLAMVAYPKSKPVSSLGEVGFKRPSFQRQRGGAAQLGSSALWAAFSCLAPSFLAQTGKRVKGLLGIGGSWDKGLCAPFFLAAAPFS